MKENKKKFAMPLVWHNCKNYPPSESYNANLVITDGNRVFPIVWDNEFGFCTIYANERRCVSPDKYEQLWWADLDQTVRGCSEFKQTERDVKELLLGMII